jgi:hypothetical protein
MNIKEVRQKQRYTANDGDLIGLYGDAKKEFKLAITLGIIYLKEIFSTKFIFSKISYNFWKIYNNISHKCNNY